MTAAAGHTHGSTNVSEPLLMSAPVPISGSITSTSASVLGPRPIYPNELPHSYSDPLPIGQKKLTHSKLPLQLAQALVISGLEYATDLTQRTFAKVLAEGRVTIETRQNKVAGEINSRNTGVSETDDDGGAWNLPDGFITVYVCPSDARERPLIHKTLVRIPHGVPL